MRRTAAAAQTAHVYLGFPHSLVRSLERASVVVANIATFPRPSLPNAATGGHKGRGRGRERERPYDSAKQKCARAWERMMPEERWRERGREQLGSQLRITCLPTMRRQKRPQSRAAASLLSHILVPYGEGTDERTPSNYFYVSCTCGSSLHIICHKRRW